jgi:hypothetical protein
MARGVVRSEIQEKRFQKRRTGEVLCREGELSSSERTAPRSSCHSTRRGSLACSSGRRSRSQSAIACDSRKTSNTAGKSSSINELDRGQHRRRQIIFDKGEIVRNGAALHIDQGIAVTSHASQAKTVDQVIASVPVRAFSQANEAQFYVSMSRARWAMYVFTDSKVALRDSATRPSKRLSSWELHELAERDRTLKAELARQRAMPKKQQQEIAYER